MNGTYCLAERHIALATVHAATHVLCADYATAGSQPDFAVETTQDDIDFERARSDRPGYADPYLETLAVYRKIAERMPAYDTFLFHGSAVAVDDVAYLFTAKSGTGKSTHTRLWRELLGARAVMVNDDKPLIRVREDGAATVYGTPWDGKHHLSSNVAVPLKAICLLGRASENRILEIGKDEAYPLLVQQTYRPHEAAALEQTLNLLDRMKVKLYRLACTMDVSAAELSFTTMREG